MGRIMSRDRPGVSAVWRRGRFPSATPEFSFSARFVLARAGSPAGSTPARLHALVPGLSSPLALLCLSLDVPSKMATSLVHVNLPASGSRSVACFGHRRPPGPPRLARADLRLVFLLLAASSSPPPSSSRAPSSLTLQPLPLLSILNHFTRRPTASQTRVIGALLGKRTEAGEVVITNSFAVPHDEARLFFAESEYKSMLESIRKVSGDKESLVGWSVGHSSAHCQASLADFAHLVPDLSGTRPRPRPTFSRP